MKIIKYPPQDEWGDLLKRPMMDNTSLSGTVQAILDEVHTHGDAALYSFAEKFDKVKLNSLAVPENEWGECEQLVSADLKAAMQKAAENISMFHAQQKTTPHKISVAPGITCWQKAVAIEKVGLYIPGGTAPLFSTVLMLAIPAKIAGCKEIVLCTPPNKQQKIHPAILYAAKIAGVSSIFKVGGAQAIAAMAYGTQTIPQVYKIFGPGNQYVTMAKQLVSLRDVAIDMPAGPSEVEVIADHTAVPEFVASDLLSQAEHGRDSQAILVTTDPELAEKVSEATMRQLEELPRKDTAACSLENSRIIVLKDMDEVIRMTNMYAPEHLIISAGNYGEIAEKITNAGSVFLGNLTPESAGDYASGTNHTLPTNGYAKAYSGVNLDSFIKKITFQEITSEGLNNIGPAIEIMAESEELFAHKNAVTLRLKQINN